MEHRIKILIYQLFLGILLVQKSVYTIANQLSMQAHLSENWYPQEEKKLHENLEHLKLQAEKLYPTTLQNVRAMIVPHAGYAYSGIVAASCFNALEQPMNQQFDKVIVLVPSHFTSFQGIAIPDHVKEYTIVTGNIKFDTKILKKLIKQSPFISSQKFISNPFDQEHSFEILCPFIHKYINKNVPIIPLLIGHLNEQDIKNAAYILKKIITPETLIIVSSDFTHYGPRFNFMPFGPTSQASLAIRALDIKVMTQLFIPSLDKFLQIIQSTQATVCGHYPIALLLALLNNKSLEPHLVAYTTSQKIDPTSNTSVSYAGIIYTDDPTPTHFEEQSLLTYAKDILLASFSDQQEETLLLPLIVPFMKKKCGTFVTWYDKNHTLRGCIGTIESTNSLIDNVRIYAKQAAFHDNRFAPITKDEAPFVTATISILSPFTKISSYRDIILGTHGILLKYGTRQAVFLPQVAVEQGWNLTTTLEQLSLKAGLAQDAWKDENCTFEICTGYEIT